MKGCVWVREDTANAKAWDEKGQDCNVEVSVLIFKGILSSSGWTDQEQNDLCSCRIVLPWYQYSYGSASSNSLPMDIGKDGWDSTSVMYHLCIKKCVMKLAIIVEDFKCNVWTNTPKKGEKVPGDQLVGCPQKDVCSVECPIFSRLQLIDVLYSSPPCRFEIGKGSLKREMVKVPLYPVADKCCWAL